MNKWKTVCKKIANILEYVIGTALAICLFVGGLGFIGFVVAFCIGGETATTICVWLYESFYGALIKISTYTTLLCFLMIYLKGDANWINPIQYWKNKTAKKQTGKTDDDALKDADGSEEKSISGVQA